MDPISAGIIGLLFILLVVFCVLARDRWHWVNIVFLILTFLVGVGASAGLAKVYKLRSAQIKTLNKNRELAVKNKQEANLLVHGSPDSPIYDPGSLRGASQALSLALTGRGRTWSGGQIAQAGEQRTFTFATPRPDDVDNLNKLKDVMLYAFADVELNGKPYPQTYIGSVMVTDETNESLTLGPRFVANVQQWTQPDATWTLFEKMPSDRHDTFKQGIVALAASNPEAPQLMKDLAASIEKDELDLTLFRQALTEVYLRADALGMDPASAEYINLIDRYTFDEVSMGKIENWLEANAGGRRFEPEPTELFIRYKFNKKSSRAYQVDADGSLDTDGAFTPLGHAIDSALHHGKEIEFAEGDFVLVDQRTADGYQRGPDLVKPFTQDEDVTEVDRMFRRQLTDFPYVLSDLVLKTRDLNEETIRVQTNNQIQAQALADTESQIQDRNNTENGLIQDGDNLKNDLDTINTLLAKLQAEHRAQISAMASLQQQMDQLYQRVEQLSRTAENQAYAGR